MDHDPDNGQDERQIVFTNKAHCQDCYRCLRVCPVKAIRMQNGQAYVDDARCLACGTCVRECPQGAKEYRGDLGMAMKLIEEGPTAVSIAPSFASVVSEPHKMPTLLRTLGFDFISETAVGAYHVAVETRKLVEESDDQTPKICSACPAAMQYIEFYRPEARGMIAPVVSPMIAHGRHLRRKLGKDWNIVFIGPCVAKKREAEHPGIDDAIDCVLTFEELFNWMQKRSIRWEDLSEGEWNESPGGDARLFPLAGGAARTGALETDLFTSDTVLASGFEELDGSLDEAVEGHGRFIEPLFCPGGCVGGPGCGKGGSALSRRERVLRYAKERKEGEKAESYEPEDIRAGAVHTDTLSLPQPTDAEILEELALGGKTDPKDRLDCGACGYECCWDKAVAVLQGMAERDMCIPRMRRLAEKRSDRIIEANPNGILLVDTQLKICSMNPAFRKMFSCTDATYGKPVSYLMDPDPFEQVAAGEVDKLERVNEHKNYGLICHEVIYRLPEEGRIVAMFVNITNQRRDRDKLDTVQREAAVQARRLLELQGEMSRSIARFLGESNARGEALVEKLITLGDTPPEDQDQ